jgi:hypothetical protein
MRLFVAFLLYFTAVLFVCLFALSGCATMPTAATPSCEALVGSVASAASQEGFKLAQTQAGPAGEMAAFVRGTTARLIYVAPAVGVADYLTTNGWTKIGECAANAATYTVLQRDIQVPDLQGSPT